MATADLGGWLTYVPQGTQGVIVDEGGWTVPMRVAFTIPGGLFSDDQVVTLDVHEDDIARM